MRVFELYAKSDARGGWAFVRREKQTGEECKKSGSHARTTNNQMSLTAILRGLEEVTNGSTVEIFSDNQEIVKGIMQYRHEWRKRLWAGVKNKDLWIALDDRLNRLTIHAVWVPKNEMNMALTAQQDSKPTVKKTVSQNGCVYELYTDGSCEPNPGAGGWAFIRKNMTTRMLHKKSGFVFHSTNNRMELTAVIEGVRGLPADSEVWIFSDSQYIVKGVNQWRFMWEWYEWENVKNVDLWKELHACLNGLKKVRARWVRGHAGDPDNTECDRMAANAREGLLGGSTKPAKAPVRRKRSYHTRQD